MHRTQVREPDMTRQDKEKLVGIRSIAEVQRGQGRVPVAWSSQGRHHCLRGGEEPPGLSGPVEGQGKREQAREAVGQPILGTGARGRDRNRHRTPAVTRFHVVPHVSEPWRDGEGSQVQGDSSRRPSGLLGQRETHHMAQDWRQGPEACHLHTAQDREQGPVARHVYT